MPQNNQITLLELPLKSATDLQKTKTFLTNVFNWTYTDYGDEYSDTTDSGTAFGLNATNSSTMPLTVIYSEDLEKTKELVIQNGGTIIVDTYSFPGGRRFHFTEPSGNELAVWSE